MLDHLAALTDKMELLDYAISTHDGHAILESTLFLHVRCFQAACLPRSKLLIPALFIVFGSCIQRTLKWSRFVGVLKTRPIAVDHLTCGISF